ncbi:amino acid adenylation domain-containing protein [Streptomyces sp. NPDC086091]|uniref:amino acid adenylation domain-containing protein n=1 Tax=Streptomyces sp. NPDC086091 TaxID=3365751 RepID=UPI003808477C
MTSPSAEGNSRPSGTRSAFAEPNSSSTDTASLLAAAVLDHARRTPDAPAVEDGSRTLTYAELDTLSGRVADRLRARGVRPGHAVAVRLPRSWHLVCVLLGIRRAGATVVPLDRLSPPDRRRHILHDSRAVAVVADLSDPSGPSDGPEAETTVLDLTLLLGDQVPARATASPLPAPSPEDDGTAFVFYTSGSTGRPKGVEVTDEGVLRLARPGYIDLPSGARYACLANPAFDALSFEVWAPLLTGGVCVVLDDATAQSPHAFAAALRARRVDTAFLTVALFNAIVEQVPDCFATTGQVLVGGEQLNARLIRRSYTAAPTSRTVLHNVYGPTEATTFALCHPIPRDFDGDTIPIGTALPGTGLLLRTPDGRTAEPGEVAELLLSGPALARGYRNLPEQTRAAFVDLPHQDGGTRRWYRTGDLVRQDTEGRVTYVGRADRQVKVRGFRIEPGEVERAILAHPAVRQAYVCTRRDAEDRNELLAFLVLDDSGERQAGTRPAATNPTAAQPGGALPAGTHPEDPADTPSPDLSFDAYDHHLAAALPPYMRPHRTHLVPALPLNANGKVDREALLRDPGTPWRADGPAAAPVTAEQRPVLDLAETILAVDGLRPGDRWIPHGGDSLKALRFRFAIMARHGVDLPQDLVLTADLATLAAVVHAADPSAGEHPPLPAADGDPRTAPATGEQERLWLLHQRDPGDRSYDVPLAFRVRGAVDHDALRHALRRSVERHPALRTRLVPGPQGLTQRTEDPYDPYTPCAVPPGEAWQAAADRFFARPFDLTDPRMLRATWLERPDGGVLLLHLHHAAVDGWSLGLLFHDLTADYDAHRAGRPDGPEHTAEDPPPVTPLDLARWQRAWHATPAYADRRTRLRARYGHDGDPSPALPAPASPPGGPDRPGAGLLRTSLDLVRRAALDRRAAALGLTRFQLLVSAFAASVYGVSGQTRPLIATPVAGRPRPEFAGAVGMFANTVLLDLPTPPRASLGDLLAGHADRVRAVLADQDVALADVLTAPALRPRDPLFDHLFVLENTEFSALRLDGCEVRPEWPQPLGAKCALTLSVVEHDAGFDCLWEYRDDFGADRAEAAGRLFRQALDHLTGHAGDPDTPLRDLVGPYRHALPDLGRGPLRRPDFTTIAEGFARQRARTPDAPAVTDGTTTLTYAELDAQANELAASLRDRHPLPADPAAPAAVALHLRPSAEHVVALLAAARLNLTVVPLDPAYPPALLRHVLAQAAPLCVLTAPDDAPALDAPSPGTASGDPSSSATASLDAIAPASLPRHPVVLAAAPAAAPVAHDHRGQRPLYTLFTSGSTGTPKGVQVPDLTLCNLLHWQRTDGGLERPAVTQQFSMLSFDVSFQEIFTTLCSGGLLRLIDPAWRHDVPALLDQLETGGAERLFLPYVALQLLAEHGVRTGRFPSRLREVVTAGEQLVCTDAVRRWFAGLPDARLFNHYGPTETHVVSGLCLSGNPADWPLRPAIGRPVAGAVLRVVDEDGGPVPPGVTGELLVGGLMALRCYLGDPAAHADRFAPDPDDPRDGVLYRTGDLARFDRDGLLHYAGRADSQVKLAGHRLELGQVEAALLQYPDVVNALATVQDGQLVAVLQCRGDDPDPAALAAHLAGLLPPHARVARFRRLTRLPRTPSGKLDRRAALTAEGHDLRPSGTRATALSPLESRLTELFETVTGRPVGPGERFFDAGATSLDLMRFQLRCAGEPDGALAFTVPDLFEHVTVRALARLIEHRATPRTAMTVGEPARAPQDFSATDAAPAPEGFRAADEARIPDAARVPGDDPVAVVGMAVRLPGAPDLAAFWDLVTSGRRGIEHFPAPDGRVGARSQMDGLLAFDPGRFTLSPAEARLMDPQQRHLLMTAVEALAHAGIGDPAATRVGLVAACGENTYFQDMLRTGDPAALPDAFRLALHHEKDFLATKAAYHLGLTGPAFTVQSACSSSLVGVHVAAGLLRQGDADVMLVGGVLVDTGLTDGYTYRPQHIFSPDGHCRPFSADAAGTVGASGSGMIVLKPLSAARRDGDTVYAVITGSGITNDGSDKLSYSAPAQAGQRAAIRTALHRSGRTGADLGYVEAHGTGTPLGDPVETAALREAYGLTADARLALSSVKSQIGHLGAAAGVVGLVRAVLAVHHGVVPPTADFDRLNPAIEDGPFRVPVTAEPWPTDRPRVAAVSSFGIGGTNAHLLLERPEEGRTAASREPSPDPSAAPPLLLLSAASAAALRADRHRVADYLAAHPEAYPRVLRHLRSGRPVLGHRAAAVCPDAASAVTWLRSPEDTRPRPAPSESTGATDPYALAAAWAAGHPVDLPPGPAPAPWDFPPPAFDTTDHDFPRADAESIPPASTGPDRLPADRWLHQLQWTRLRRARPHTDPAARAAVVVAAPGTDPAAWRCLTDHYARVVLVETAAPGTPFTRHDDDHYAVDPADTTHLTALLTRLTRTTDPARPDAPAPAWDWLHALPLALGEGPGDPTGLETAQWACLDTVAALARALSETPPQTRPRVWLLSRRAQPVDGTVRVPAAALLAPAVETPRQELGVTLRWLDLPDDRPAAWAHLLPDLPTPSATGTADAHAVPVLALRDGFWWHRSTQPVPAPRPAPAADTSAAPGTYLVLGGTGGIGGTLAARLLARPGTRTVLVSRHGTAPAATRPYGDRVTVVRADLATEDPDTVAQRLAPHLDGLTGVVHAVGTAAGGLLARRDPAVARHATAAKLRAALLVERLIASHAPDLVVYCSSAAALHGGVGQFDYAAANAYLDACAHTPPDAEAATVRVSVGWDAWREVGMAADTARTGDARHRAHLAVALTPEDGTTVFEQALDLRLPHLLVSTTEVDRARAFYGPGPGDRHLAARPGASASPDPDTDVLRGAHRPATPAGPTADGTVGPDPAADLADLLAELLGVDTVDPAAPLYDLGADSLTLLELIDEIKRRYGTDVSLSGLSHRVTLTEILGHLDTAAHRATGGPGGLPDIEVWQRGTGRDVLCLVHPVGGDIQAYRPLVSALPDTLTVCLIADPALRDPRPSARSLTARAASYLHAVRAEFPAPDHRLHLAGWSFGAWAALSMAALAERDASPGQPVRPAVELYLIDPPPPGAGARLAAYDDRQVDAVFARELSGNAAHRLTPTGRAYAEGLARCCRANLAAMADHRLPHLTRTPAVLWLADRAVTTPDATAASEVTPAPVPVLAPEPTAPGAWNAHLPVLRTHHVDADHYQLVAAPHVEAIADVIASAAPESGTPADATGAPRPPARQQP